MDPRSQAFNPYYSHITNSFTTHSHFIPSNNHSVPNSTRFIPKPSYPNYPNYSSPNRSKGHNVNLNLEDGRKLQSDVSQLEASRIRHGGLMLQHDERLLEHVECLAEHTERLNQHAETLKEHSERLARLERRLDDDARAKSIWGQTSPFPGVLSGTPQQAPQQYSSIDPTAERGFGDDDTNHMMSSLHLDAEEEPRSRALGANSRANNVRFDETANQNHFSSHSSRPSSMEVASRGSSTYSGGLHMGERSSSHRSDGRASSVHSMRSLASGRASSLNMEYGTSSYSPSDTPNLAPGVMMLGAVPAIIRIWMNTNFKHNTLLYAAVCTGSYKSLLDLRLIQKLGFDNAIRTPDQGPRTVALPIYFPEAVPLPTAGRASSPAPQLPSLLIEFVVMERATTENESKAIQIFIGSDVLVAHNADIMFSSSSMSLYDQQRNKLRIPLVRPESEDSFNGLFITSGEPQSVSQVNKAEEEPPKVQKFHLDGLGRDSIAPSVSSPSPPPAGKYRPPGALAAASGSSDHTKLGNIGSDSEGRPVSRQSTSSRPSLQLNTRQDDQPAEPGSQTMSGRTGPLTASWRRDGAQSTSTPAPAAPAALIWGSASKSTEVPQQPKTSGMKVLKPKLTTRMSNATPISAGRSSPASDGRSKFFDNGRRRSDDEVSKPNTKDNQTPTSAPKAKTNPIGTASAFSWLGKQ